MASNRTVQYVDFGITTARQYWDENVVTSFETFKNAPNRTHAINASMPAWHVHEWIWHEKYPGKDTRQNAEYRRFQGDLINACPELAWIRDVADAGKHRGLGRPADVQRVASEMSMVYGSGTAPSGSRPSGGGLLVRRPLTITLTDGSNLEFEVVLSRVLEYWRANHFP